MHDYCAFCCRYVTRILYTYIKKYMFRDSYIASYMQLRCIYLARHNPAIDICVSVTVQSLSSVDIHLIQSKQLILCIAQFLAQFFFRGIHILMG